ncbi:hypothetical protein ACUODJ_43595, partial [Escherichia sp. HC-CC]
MLLNMMCGRRLSAISLCLAVTFDLRAGFFCRTFRQWLDPR